MAIELPAEQKVYTTTYSDFRGVDYTNDPTNVWRRRSPSGVNMLPDASGRPFKRYGWESVISADDLITYLDVDETIIHRCFYFELAGQDHVVLFAEGGVFVYVEDTLALLEGSDDVDCYSSWDRAFFFEGGGKSAFYIYGNYKVWRYDYENEFRFMTVEPEIPTIMISASADCVGTTLNPYNMLSNKASIEYNSNSLFHYSTSGEMAISVAQDTFLTKVSNARNVYVFIYDGANWKLNGSVVDISQYGITIGIGTPSADDKITVVYKFGVLLSQNVSQDQIDDCKAYITKVTQFDYELEVKDKNSTPSPTQCVLHTDEDSYPKESRVAWIEFYADYSTPAESQEDTIKITMPATEVTIDNYVEVAGGGQATLVKGGGF